MLKFAPAFTEIADSDANADGLQLSTCCKSIASELEITPPSFVGSSSNVEEELHWRGRRGREGGEKLKYICFQGQISI
ncbi:MCE family protein [Sesbania bispinosa]|nr:MCE family protein [Sesbania bispinosa]